MADTRRVLEQRLRESLAEHPDLPAMVPRPLPLTMRRAQKRRLRRRWVRRLWQHPAACWMRFRLALRDPLRWMRRRSLDRALRHADCALAGQRCVRWGEAGDNARVWVALSLLYGALLAAIAWELWQ